MKKAKTVLEDYIKNPNVEHENPKINHDQNARMHARRHAATMKLVKERREESKQKALAFIVAILGVSGFMLYMWHLQTTTMRKITKIEFINMSKKYKGKRLNLKNKIKIGSTKDEKLRKTTVAA